jgi:hypothetical protein
MLLLRNSIWIRIRIKLNGRIRKGHLTKRSDPDQSAQDRIRIRIQVKKADPDLHEGGADPQHFLMYPEGHFTDVAVV